MYWSFIWSCCWRWGDVFRVETKPPTHKNKLLRSKHSFQPVAVLEMFDGREKCSILQTHFDAAHFNVTPNSLLHEYHELKLPVAVLCSQATARCFYDSLWFTWNAWVREHKGSEMDLQFCVQYWFHLLVPPVDQCGTNVSVFIHVSCSVVWELVMFLMFK